MAKIFFFPMLLSELFSALSELLQKIETGRKCLHIDELSDEIETLRAKSLEGNFWDDPKEASAVLQALSQKEKKKKLWNGLLSNAQGLSEILEMVEEDSVEQKEMEVEFLALQKEYATAEVDLLLSGVFDRRNALLEITAGAGGTEAQDFAEMLLRMYLRFAERKNWKVEILEKSDGVEAGIKSCLLEMEGENAFGLLQAEKGTHRLVRQSPFNAKNLRQTSFAGVMVTPQLEEVDTENIVIPESEIRVDTFRASGAGGQHVNKTDSAVRMVHIPTGTIVTCQTSRSQHQNRDKAMQVLKSRIAQKKREEEEAKAADIRGEHTEAAWGTQIRNYVLHPYKLVKDLRTEHESLQPDTILDGDLDEFHQKFLEWKARGKKE